VLDLAKWPEIVLPVRYPGRHPKPKSGMRSGCSGNHSSWPERPKDTQQDNRWTGYQASQRVRRL